tara:strand:- start:832 stop:1992 length:1161 start_codon:yes stop_codon:yes gene_type:complete
MKKKRAKKFLKSGMVAAPDFKFTGEEPTWHNCPEEKYDDRILQCFNFYNYYLDRDDFILIIQEYMKKNSYTDDNIAVIPHVPKSSYILNITGKLCRCFNMGMPNFGKYPNTVKKYVGNLISEAKRELFFKKNDSVQKAKVSKKPNVHTIMTEKVRTSILCELEEMLDAWIEPKVKIKKLPVASMLRGENIPVSFVGPVVQWLERHKNDYTDAYEKRCPDMVEGFSYLSKPQLRNRIKALDEMLNEIVLYKSSKKAARKPRTKKPKSADKQVSRLNYLNESEEYCMQSCDPTRIVGAQKFFMFNTKYRKMTVFTSLGRDGFTVQGSTLKGFDESQSYSLTLRKPKEILPILSAKTERQIDKELAKLTTKRKPANGRINKDTILIRTI